jgi:mono/diheme cytochrome c family protein
MIISLLTLGLYYSCQQKSVVNTIHTKAFIFDESMDIAELSVEDGNELLAQNCFACHNPRSLSHDDMLAPPLAGIKYKYQNSTSGRSEFIKRMSTFVYEPDSKKALMKGPVKRFGVMPKTALSKDEILSLVAFIYDQPIQEPTWFSKHFEEKHGYKWNP